MNLQEKINQDIKEAMLEKNTQKLAALRAVKAAVLLESAKDGSNEISDQRVIKLITKLLKQRKESARIYNDQNRKDLAHDEEIQSKYLEIYLPKPLSSDEIREIINNIIIALGDVKVSDMGKVIGLAISKTDGRADGKIVAQITQDLLKK